LTSASGNHQTIDLIAVKEGPETFVCFITIKILFLFSLLPVTVNAQEIYPRRNT